MDQGLGLLVFSLRTTGLREQGGKVSARLPRDQRGSTSTVSACLVIVKCLLLFRQWRWRGPNGDSPISGLVGVGQPFLPFLFNYSDYAGLFDMANG